MKQILCFGDSNTYGLIPGTKDRYDWDTRWSGRIGQRLWEDGCRIVEEGLCGRTTVFDDPLRDGRRGTELLSVILETHKPVDVVVLMLGTNDCKTMYDTSAEVIGRGVERLLDQIRSSTPDRKRRASLLSHSSQSRSLVSARSGCSIRSICGSRPPFRSPSQCGEL